LTRDTKIDVFVSMEFKIYPVFLKVVPWLINPFPHLNYLCHKVSFQKHFGTEWTDDHHHCWLNLPWSWPLASQPRHPPEADRTNIGSVPQLDINTDLTDVSATSSRGAAFPNDLGPNISCRNTIHACSMSLLSLSFMHNWVDSFVTSILYM
jgi:hypothetical protein